MMIGMFKMSDEFARRRRVPAAAWLGAGLAFVLLSLPAQSAGPCGDGYTVRPGDTLAGIAARCGTTVRALTQVNGFIRNPAQIEVGWRLAMPGAGRSYATTPAPDPYPQSYRGQPGYRVQPGDSFAGIAQALGLSIAMLLAENRGLDPKALVEGMLLNLPGRRYDPGYDRRYDPRWEDEHDDRDPRLGLKPDEGRRGDRIDIRLRDLRPRERVLLALVEEDGRTVSLGQERADGKGRIDRRITVPDWASHRRDLRVVAERRTGELLHSGRFDVKRHRTAKRDQNRSKRRLEGWVVRGVECPVLRTPGGKSFSLVSDRERLPLGSYVELSARKVDISYCQEGDATFEVSSVRRIDPPR